jgi:hypothetical protein
MAVAGGYVQDVLTRIINVQWGSVIAIFADQGTAHAAGFQAPADYAPIDHVAELLTTFNAPYQPDTLGPGYKCFAFKVGANAGEFMTVTWPGIKDVTVNQISMHVFAMDGDIASSLSRATAGAMLIVPSLYAYSHGGNSNIPAQAAPPGLLWSIASDTIAGREVKWKMRTGEHRPKQEPEPLPNTMVQCYPLDSAFSPPDLNYTTSGYNIMAYRLDGKGTGTAYGTIPNLDFENPQPIDPAWKQKVFTLFYDFGIPFADPPPLISADVI